MPLWTSRCFAFFFNDTATTEIYTLSLHDALPISIVGRGLGRRPRRDRAVRARRPADVPADDRDRKSTRLNSSHVEISYAVFCLKKKKKKKKEIIQEKKKKTKKKKTKKKKKR